MNRNISPLSVGTVQKAPRWLFLFSIVAALLAAHPCAAQTCNYTVTSLADSGAGTLRAGLADSTVTDICFGVQGTITLSSALQITTAVTIDGNGITVSGNNQFQIFYVSLSVPGAVPASRRPRGARSSAIPDFVGGPTTTINGMTLTNGNAPYGGAIQIGSGNLVLVGTALTNNTAANGGAIYNTDTVTLSQCSFTGNTATSGTGGAVNNSEGTLTIQGAAFTSNSSPTGAGAVYNSGVAQVTGAALFSGNTGYQGGAIYNDLYGTLTISGGTTFANNVATVTGAAVDNLGTANIAQALFSGNSAQATGDVAASGGGMYNAGGATISESTFTGNTSTQNGGGISYGGGTLTLVNDTIAGNTAALSGSGIDVETTATPTINNTIIANNTAIAGNSNSDCGNCSTENGSNNLIGVNPYLGPLAQNGGPTQTLMPLPGGPAVGGGSASLTADTTDQRGFSRVAANGSIDIGAVQSHYSAVTFSTQPSNTYVNTLISPAVGVQVLEVDGTTNNYPLGVPVTVSLFTSQGIQSSSNLAGTLTKKPSVVNGLTAATFSDLSVNAVGSYEMQATIVATPTSALQDPAYGVTSNVFLIFQVTLGWQPAQLTYGPTPAGELNAVATINGQPATGTFIYTFTNGGALINVGQVYPVGTYGVQVAYTPTGSTGSPYILQTTMQIRPATPTLSWPTPAPIYTSTPLSAAQLDATATGVAGAALAGFFVYAPAAGTTLTAGAHSLAVTFTPTDSTDYTAATAQVTLQVGYAPISIASFSPSTISLSASPISISITGTGFMTSSVVELNGTPIATTFQSATALTATIPAADLATASTLSLTIYDSVSKLTSNVIPIPINAPAANISFTIPQANASGEQAPISLGLNSPYPADLTGTLTLSFAPTVSSGVDDPAIQFSTGGRTLNFTIPAGSTSTPQVGLQTGTVAGAITITLSLAASGVDVTPAGVSPITLVIAPAAPVITNVAFINNSSGLITVVITGFSNTREVTQTEFVFTGSGANSLNSSKVDIPVSTLFSPWYSSTDSDQFGSAFTYTQQFQLSSPDSTITGATATLTNSIGTSESVSSQ